MNHVTYLLTIMTMVVMRAAKKTNAPNDARAMIELTLNRAPYVDDGATFSSPSTDVGISTS